MTFMRLININSALGDKDLGDVLKEPTPFDLSVIAYCLLDDKSLEFLEDVKVKLSDKIEEANSIHKLYYLMCENNISDGLTNYTSILQCISDVIQDSTSARPTKKKILVQIFHWISTKFSTR